ncbi:MAG: hypothetical protein AAGG54_02400 [Pseudomonadota bacterium]
MTKLDNLEAQLQAARKDVETLAAMAGSSAKEVANDAADMAATHMEALSEDARRLYYDARDEGRKAKQVAEAQIQANPLSATGVAFVLGIALAMLISRRA